MTKEVDDNGFWRIRENPLSKEGVFPYLGKQIDKSLEPNKIYYVYRPIHELANPETVESFNAIPLIDEHEMIGEGFTKYDNRPAAGVVYNTKVVDNKLLGDIRIFSESLKEEIENGKKELSMGYSCRYEPAQGIFDGKKYDFIQTDLRGNHVALVNRGRMGSDVRVYDQKITFDTLEGLNFDNDWENQERGDDGKWILSISTENIMGDKTEEEYRKDMLNQLLDMRGDKVFNKSLNADIEIRISGIKKYNKFSADVNKVHLIPYLKGLLAQAKFGKPESSYTQQTEPNIKGYFKASPELFIDGKKKYANFTVRQDDKGHFFWDLQIEQSSQHATPVTIQGDTGAYDSNITQDYDDVNIYFVEEEDNISSQGQIVTETEPKGEPVDITITIDKTIPSQDGSPKESGVDCSLNQQGTDSMEKVDKRKGISEVEAMLYEAKKDPAKLDDELIKTILQKMENNSYEASEKSEADDKSAKDEKEAKDACKAKDEDKSDEAKKTADGEGLTKEKKDEEKDKDPKDDKKEAKDEAVTAAMDALPKILESLEGIKELLKGREKSEDKTVMYGLDNAPVVSNKMDKGLQKYLGE